MHVNLRQQRQGGLKAVPQPFGDNFTCRVLKPLNLVQAVVVQSLAQRLNRSLDLAVVDQVVLTFWNIALNDDIDSKRMSMHPPTLVPFGKGRQKVGGFKVERLGKANVHGDRE